jgi:hypothetical protein
MRSHNLICNQKQAVQEQVKNKWLYVIPPSAHREHTKYLFEKTEADLLFSIFPTPLAIK